MNRNASGLYHPVILQHNANPYHFEKREQSTYILEAYNQLCGDQFTLYLDVDERHIINHAHFYGYGCAISKASTSVLVSLLEGHPLEYVKKLIHTFYHEVLPEGRKESLEIIQKIPTEFDAFAVAKNYPSRIKCATLSWDELHRFLKK